MSPDDVTAPYVNLVQRLAEDLRLDNFGQARIVANLFDHDRNVFLQRKNAVAESEMHS